MGAIAFTPFVDGQVLGAAALTQQQTEISAVVNGDIDDSNVRPGTLTGASLAAPEALFVITVPCSVYFDAKTVVGSSFNQSEFQASKVGISKDNGSAVDFPVPIPVACKLVGLATSCYEMNGTSGTASVSVDGSSVGSTLTDFVDGGTDMTNGLNIALDPTSVVKVTVAPPLETHGGLVAPVVYLFCSAPHRVAA
jgi:hypothetical protein